VDRLLDAAIGIQLDATTRGPAQTDWQQDPQLASASFLTNRFQGPLAEQIQFEFTHGAFEAQEESVVNQGRIVDTIRIDNDGAHHAAQLDQVMPITTVPREPRGFETKDRPDLSRADFRHESLESGSLRQARPGTAEILINDDDLLKPQRAGVVDQSILPPLTFLIVDDLPR